MFNKKLILPAVTAIVIGSGILLSTKPAKAEGSFAPMSGFVEALVSKFGLNQTEVQTFVDNYRQQRQTEMQTLARDRENTYLSGLVSEGKITEDQKQAILQKHEELRSQFSRDGISGLTPVERRQKMDEKRSELTSWAQSQGIDTSYLMLGFGGREIHSRSGLGRFDEGL